MTLNRHLWQESVFCY